MRPDPTPPPRWCGHLRWLAFVLCIVAAVASTGRVSADGPADEALSYLGQGEAAYEMGDFAAAIDHLSQAIGICRVAGLEDLEVTARARRGETFARLGHLDRAEKDLGAALAAADDGTDPARVAAIAGALGNVRLMGRDLDAARALLDRSLLMALEAGDQAVVAAAANNRGNLALAENSVDAALSYYRRAAAAAAQAADPRLTLVATTNAARAATGLGRLSEAMALLREALSLVDRENADSALALISVARIAIVLADKEAERTAAGGPAIGLAFRALSDAAEIGGRLDDARTLSLAYGWLGHLYERAERDAESLRLTETALFEAQRAEAPELSFRWQWQIGRLARRSGDLDGATVALRAALEDLSDIRVDIPVEYIEGRSSFRDRYGPLYLDAADVLLRRVETAQTSDAQVLLVEARSTIEGLKAVELQDYFDDDCVARFQSSRTDLGEISANTAIIYPIVLPDRLVVLADIGGALRQYVSLVPREELTDIVYRLRQLLEKRTTRQYRRPAKRIWDMMVAPVYDDLVSAGVDTLVFVPDGALRTVPIGALYDGRKHLVEHFATAVAPGLDLVDPQPVESTEARALVGGISESVQGFMALSAVVQEVEEIGGIYPGEALINERFQVDGFTSEIIGGDYNIIHVASHGVFSHQSGDSFILTYDGRMDLDTLEAAIKFRRFDDTPIDLLTLSACTTATGDDRAALGLAGVALKSGARSALASLWSVNDESSAALISGFYKTLSEQSGSKAQALRQSQAALLADPRFRHPVYWAAFLVIGNWL